MVYADGLRRWFTEMVYKNGLRRWFAELPNKVPLGLLSGFDYKLFLKVCSRVFDNTFF
jgi:hypothetical protein